MLRPAQDPAGRRDLVAAVPSDPPSIRFRQREHGPLSLVLPMLAVLAGCERVERPVRPPTPLGASVAAANGPVATRLDGTIPKPVQPAAAYLYGVQPAAALAARAGTAVPPSGPYALDFTDTDVREVVTQILGGLLHANFTIDPAVHGSVRCIRRNHCPDAADHPRNVVARAGV